jgi:phytoene dehydrogenase-like protein
VTDIVVIGGGHNGLVAAWSLARAGRRPLVIERRPFVGGGATTEDIHPGFRCPRLTHEVLLDAQIASDMGLRGAGLELLPTDVRVCAPAADGPPVVLYEDERRTAESLRVLSPKDAGAYLDFAAALARVASVVGATFDAPPPDVDAPSAGDLWNLLKTGRRIRALGRRDLYRLLRWLAMPVSDLVGQWFDHELLQAVLAGPGVSGTMLGPRSAGSALVLLLREAARQRAGGRSLQVRGGPGALTRALAEAARRAGVEVRIGATVDRILVREERVVGVIVDGRELPCSDVVASTDPRTTFLSLLDPLDLTPDFARRIRNYRARGALAKVNLALASLPSFRGVTDPRQLSGRVHIGPDLDYLERAFDRVKYGEVSDSPWLDITIPSIVDTDLAPDGAHVASVYVHYAPAVTDDADPQLARDMLLSRTIATLEACAPDIRSLIVAAEILMPGDLERDLGLGGGHIFHGELALDQLFTMRPLLGHSGYSSPIRGLYLCGAGTHPGGFMTGTSGRLAARAVSQRYG